MVWNLEAILRYARREVVSTVEISYAVVWFVVHLACRPKLITIDTNYIQVLLYPAICSATILIDCHACHMNILTCHS